MKTPKLILACLLVFWIMCWFSAAKKDGHVKSGESLYGLFLVYQLFGFGINIAMFFTGFLMWHAQSKFIRVVTLGLEAIQKQQGMAWLLRLYVAIQLFYFLYSLIYLVRKEQNPRGRTLKLFHESLKPIKAWVNLRYNPGGALTTFMLVDLTFGYLTNVYYVIERVYRNLYSQALERLARLVCAVEIIMHIVTLTRLSSVANTQELKYSTPFISWIIFYCTFSAICLLVVFAGMMYSHQLRHDSHHHHHHHEHNTSYRKKCE